MARETGLDPAGRIDPKGIDVVEDIFIVELAAKSPKHSAVFQKLSLPNLPCTASPASSSFSLQLPPVVGHCPKAHVAKNPLHMSLDAPR